MAELASTAWYRLGTVSVTDGSTKVTGSGTKFLTAGINPGAALRFDTRPYEWEIKRVVSDTELELAVPYYGGTVSNITYSIDRNHQSTLPAILAARLAKAMGNWEERYDTDMQTITGKSAYEIALEHGYSGTETQWLESLKAANEWSTLNDRTNILTRNTANAHNSYYRGKGLGTTITAAQIATIQNGRFEDIYPGDYWWLTIDGNSFSASVVGLDHYYCHGYWTKAKWTHHAAVWLRNFDWVFPVNDTATTTGGLLNSKLYTETLPALLAKIEQIIPPEYILSWPCYVCDAVDSSGSPNHYTDTEQRIFLPSEMEIYGMHTVKESYQGHNKMWPYSRWATDHVAGWDRVFWLDAPSSATAWCCAHPSQFNLYRYTPANHSSSGGFPAVNVWPYILIGKEDS